MIMELRDALLMLLPLNESEIKFVEMIRKTGKIEPKLIINEIEFAEDMMIHSAVQWAAKRTK